MQSAIQIKVSKNIKFDIDGDEKIFRIIGQGM